MCCTIMCNMHQESVKLMECFSTTQERVLDIFIILVPGIVALCQVLSSQKIFSRPMDVIASTELVLPDADHMTYFCLHQKTIKCSWATVEEASFSAGSFCDQQQLNHGPTLKSSCMYMSAKGAGDFVIDVDITFDVNRSFHSDGKVTVSYFWSWKTSNLLAKISMFGRTGLRCWYDCLLAQRYGGCYNPYK